MKKKITYVFFIVIAVSLSINAVTFKYWSFNPNHNIDSLNLPVLFKDNTPTQVTTSPFEVGDEKFIPGEIIIRFKDEISLNTYESNGRVYTNIGTINNSLDQYQPRNIEKIFPNEERNFSPRTLRTPSGEFIEEASLHNIFKITIGDTLKTTEAIESLKNDDNVLFAEPNYIVAISSNVENNFNQSYNNQNYSNNTLQTPVNPNDSLYSQQWYLDAVNAPDAWNITTGDTTQVIAIIDTGIDWNHPDLQTKIWINYAELNGLPGVDDDGNGYIDDIRGWDWINNDNNPNDDNSHGTHVAGIAGANSNNGIGIAGVSWGAKLMPIKVFQSSGYSDIATIIQGINYARLNGATILNMSFGTYASSVALQQALGLAYSTAVLVAAAGNDGICIGPGYSCAPMYPAALSYVIGVEAGSASFSNYDQDGPVISRYPNLLNYETKAPGVGIISLIPNGGYRIYSGTSMAAPIVSGAVSLYRSIHPSHSQEFMWANMINSTSSYLNISGFLQNIAPTKLWLINHNIVDTIDGDGDGKVDAGETIDFWVTVRNTGVQADSVYCGIRFSEFEDTSLAQIQIDESFIGSISPYAMSNNRSSPLRLKFRSDIANNRDIVFETMFWHENSSDTIINSVVLKVQNGREFSGFVSETTILTPERLNIITDNVIFDTLIIKPGTTISINNGKKILFRILDCNGTPDSMIIFTINGSGHWAAIEAYGGQINDISYCIFEYGGNSANTNLIDVRKIEDCIFRYNIKLFSYSSTRFFRNVFTYNSGNIMFIGNQYGGNSDTVIKHNSFISHFRSYYGIRFQANPSKFTHNIAFNNFSELNSSYYSFSYQESGFYITEFPANYHGTSDSAKIEANVLDFFEDPSFPVILAYPQALMIPPDSAHGIVWKVLVNGKDAQDEEVEPVGVGTSRFDVYFNRRMDTTFIPFLAFGVREPYTQNMVMDSARWSEDGKIWTAYRTITLATGDGINRVHVSGARDYPDRFEIPIEDSRFNFLISAAGSLSSQFNATPGIGKVDLSWDNRELVDYLGFNMYRFHNINDSTYSQPVLVNNALITDTIFTDNSVVPNINYHYYYKILRTNLTETDSSKIVSTIPFAAAPGDANGDMVVNVQDITTIIAYILGQNPLPFLFDAADINNDQVINVLDVVGVVNLILNSAIARKTDKNILDMPGTGSLQISDNVLKLSSSVPVRALQFRIVGENASIVSFTPEPILNPFQVVSGNQGDTSKTYLIFSFSDTLIASGAHDLGTFTNLHPGLLLKDIVIVDSAGNNIITEAGNEQITTLPNEYYLNQNYPNPFNPITKIKYGLPKSSLVSIKIYDILGREVRTFDIGNQQAGNYIIEWNGTDNFGNILGSGIYFFRLQANNYIETKRLMFLK